jgi:hypothetical protein
LPRFSIRPVSAPLSGFCKRRLKALAGLHVHILTLCEKAGLVKPVQPEASSHPICSECSSELASDKLYESQ